MSDMDELLAKLEGLGPLSDDQRNRVVCALIGHSRIQNLCFGYYSCGRCGAQVGDSWGSVYPEADNVVIIGHNCDTCRKNYEQCTWKDTLFVPDPFSTGGDTDA